MSKKKKRQGQESGDCASVIEPISSRGWKVIGAGVVILALGFIVLSRTDPMGRNWASQLAPFLILGAYVVIGYGIFVPGNSQLGG